MNELVLRVRPCSRVVRLFSLSHLFIIVLRMVVPFLYFRLRALPVLPPVSSSIVPPSRPNTSSLISFICYFRPIRPRPFPSSPFIVPFTRSPTRPSPHQFLFLPAASSSVLCSCPPLPARRAPAASATGSWLSS